MAHGLGARQRLDTNLRIDPRLVLSSHLLQLAQFELEDAIDAELAENPALERLQEDSEPIHEDQILKSIGQTQSSLHSDDYEYRRSGADEDDSVDWTELTPDLPSLRDHLIAQLLPIVPPEYRALGRYLVDSLNHNGYLEEPDEEIALATNHSIEEVQSVVALLQKCEPAGIGARNLQECLLLQLRDANTPEEKLARAILRSRMDDFLARKTMRIARRFGVMPDLVESAFEEITRLTPYPGDSFSVISFNRLQKAFVAAPDLVIMRDDQNWSVEVIGPDPGLLCISRTYRDRSEELKRALRNDKDEKRHVQHYVQRANDFLSGLEQRRKTLRSIGEFLVREQASFLNTGAYQFLRPLTRSHMADQLGMHESTVSRATADKFVQIPTGAVVSFDIFFKPALRIQKMIEEILATENPENPLSDDRIAELLARQGVQVARRTVNKYRDRTKLLSSRKRRSA